MPNSKYQRCLVTLIILELCTIEHEENINSTCDFQARQELEKIRRRLEAELADLREQLNEKSSQLEELQAQMNKREEELQRALNRSVNHTY